MIKTTIEDGTGFGLDLKGTLSKSATITEAVNVLQNLVKNLMKTKDEADNYESIGMSTVLNGEVKNGDEKIKEEEISQKDLEAKHNIVRVYSNVDASGKLYLKRIQTVAESKKQNKIIKYPLAPSFYAASRKKRNILILAKHDQKRLARRAGLVTCEGFNYNAKNNNLVWPYPCPRPSFKTAWLYKTACLNSIQSVAMQLHVLWTCLRWDDMHTRPLSVEGKTQETTETAIITTEIVKARHIGRFQEVTEYFRRKITIPLNVPSNKNADNTPIRSGLRKRKREEAPVQTEPELKEEWIPEDKLELHEIRGYHERLERDRNAAVTRTRSGVGVREPQRLDPGHQESSHHQSRVRSDVNAASTNVKTLNQTTNRSVLHQNQTSPLTTISANAPGAPTIIRRIQNPDGTVTIMKTVMNAPNQSRMVQSTPQAGLQPQAKKVFISKDGKIIGAQLLQQPQSSTGGGSPATTKISIPSVGGVSNPVATPTIVQPHQLQQQQQPQTQQKVQIVRSSDGKIQVRGLLPGQQLVQMPDGKLQIFSQPTPGQPAVQATIPQPTVQTPVQVTTPVQMPVQTPPSTTVQQSSRIVVHPNGATTTTASNQTTPKIVTPGNKSIVATPLQPGQSIPPGTTVFMSGGKTYCIPKATIANQQTSNQTTTPALPSTPVPPQQLTPATPATPVATPVAAPATPAGSAPTTPTIGTVQSQTTTGQKQMVEVKSLGQNTVTFKGQQMIVSGPDIAQAQLIAKQLSSGAAKLATLNGKQVLISTQPSVVQQQQPAAAAINKTVTTSTASSATIQASPSATPTPSTPQTTSAIPNNVKLPSEPLPPAAVVKSPEKTVENQSVLPQTATAQFIQTPQGPRIVLHGIQGANLTPEQLSNVQQQVKEQLLKAQAEAKKAGTVPPTKIQINLPQTTAKPAAATATPTATATPATPVATPTSVVNSPTTRHIITTPTGQRVILMGSSQNSGQKQLITVPHSTSMTPVTVTTASNTEVVKPTVVNTTASPATTQSLLMTSLIQPKTSTISANAGGASIKAASMQSQDKFELTPDYIQQTIQTALKKDNLSPEIEQKLLALQEQHHDKSIVLKKNQKLIDPASGEPMDDEWEGATYAERSLANKNRRKRQEEKVIADRVAQNAKTPSAAALARSAMNKPLTQTPTSTGQQRIIVNNVPAEINDNEEKKVNVQQKLNLALLRHKEQLKRDISKKRKSQENQIKENIDEEIEKIKEVEEQPASVTLVAGQPMVVNSVKKDEVSEEEDDYRPQTLDHPPTSILQNSYEVASTVETIPVNNVVSRRSPSPTMNNKRKRNESSDNESNESSAGTVLPPRNKKKRRSEGGNANENNRLPAAVKRDKLYCICKTRYDPKKFYVGCDVCNNWFHGSCVGITETMAKTMTEYQCDECRNARDNSEIYCICKQPYDETQFYIGCENCSDWFHGRCVGILQCEADRIEEYICPRCDPNSKLNVPNQKKLTAEDCEAIKRLVKQLLANRSSIPFQQPVDPNEVPNYYKVIKEPMDLSSVERKVNNGQYTKLCEFIGDVMRIFENCRFFNQPNTSIMKSAQSLETFFSQKLSQLREKVAAS